MPINELRMILINTNGRYKYITAFGRRRSGASGIPLTTPRRRLWRDPAKCGGQRRGSAIAGPWQ